MAWEPSLQIGADSFLRKRRDPYFFTMLISLYIGPNIFQWMSWLRQFLRAVYSQDEQTRGFAAACEKRRQIERRIVTPMQIFQHKNKRNLFSEDFHGLGHLAQHPFA